MGRSTWYVGMSGNRWLVLEGLTVDSENVIARCASQEIAQEIVDLHNEKIATTEKPE